MTTGELFNTAIPYCVVAAAFVGSLFACRTWIQRLFFTLVMPAAYGLLWFLGMLILGSVAGIAPAGLESLIDQVAAVLAAGIAAAIFVLQVIAMSKDSTTSGSDYVPNFRGRPSHVAEEPELPHVVTQRRYMR